MCGRARCTLQQEAIEKLATVPASKWVDWDRFQPRYNLSPGYYMPILLTIDEKDETEFKKLKGEENEKSGDLHLRAVHCMKWGLVPSFTKPNEKADHFRMFNARSESLHEKPSFRRLLKHRRCVAVVDGFYEWKTNGKQKQPYFIHLMDRKPLLFAALYDHCKRDSGEIMQTFTIVTTRVSKRLEWLHDRMPVILSTESAVQQWFEGELALSDIERISQPYEGEDLVWYPVTPAMGKASFEGAECVAEIKPSMQGNSPIGKFFTKNAAKKQEIKEELSDKTREHPQGGEDSKVKRSVASGKVDKRDSELIASTLSQDKNLPVRKRKSPSSVSEPQQAKASKPKNLLSFFKKP